MRSKLAISKANGGRRDLRFIFFGRHAIYDRLYYMSAKGYGIGMVAH
jgi:hypothetical protein